MAEGEVQRRKPGQTLARTLESVRERSQDASCSTEKLPLKVQKTQKPLESRLIQGRRKGGDGGGVFHQRQTSRD